VIILHNPKPRNISLDIHVSSVLTKTQDCAVCSNGTVKDEGRKQCFTARLVEVSQVFVQECPFSLILGLG
jgi:hypothetical protein